jgi:hypothetical protein
LYSSCPQEIPEDYRNIGLLNTSKFIGFPANDFIRTHSWYGGSNTGRASKILYVGEKAQKSYSEDAFAGLKRKDMGKGTRLIDTYADVSYPEASKRNLEQNATLAASVANTDQFGEVTETLSNFLDSIRDKFDAENTVWVEMGAFGSSPTERDWDTLYHELKAQIGTVKDDSTGEMEKDYVVELNNDSGTYSFGDESGLKTDWDEAATALINSADQNRLRFYVSVRGDASKNYVSINFCLTSLFVTRDSNGNLKPVSLTSEAPLGTNPLGDPYQSLSETVAKRPESFFDLGNITINNVYHFKQSVEDHLLKISTSLEVEV